MIAIALLLAASPGMGGLSAWHPGQSVSQDYAGKKRAARIYRKPRDIVPTSTRLQLGHCGAGMDCGTLRSPYRLPLPTVAEPSTKDMALAEDGRRCSLTGDTACLPHARQIVHIGEPAPGIPASAIVK